jgi:hypothetical protein
MGTARDCGCSRGPFPFGSVLLDSDGGSDVTDSLDLLCGHVELLCGSQDCKILNVIRGSGPTVSAVGIGVGNHGSCVGASNLFLVLPLLIDAVVLN